MKKQLLLFILLLLTQVVNAAVMIDEINYNLDYRNQTAEVTSGGSYSGDIVIPSSITYDGIEYCVTSIGNWAFYDCSSLTSITIPNSVTSIGDGAFCGCSGLTSVTLGNSVTSIGGSAFCWCEELTSITIPNSVTSIGDGAFCGCSGLTSVTLGNSVTSIGGSAFSGCSGLTSIDIPNSVTSIKAQAFHGTAWYDNQPDGVVYIGKYLYCYKGAMPDNTSIIIPDGTYSIVGDAFLGRYELTSITIPNSVTSIGDRAFDGCSSLTSIDIPNSVTSIGDMAFDGCSSLTSIDIPNSVTSIGEYAFRNCSILASITIPNSLTNIEKSTFFGCSSLTSITIPNSVTSIGEGAFRRCSGLKSVTIPNSVTTIDKNAFYDCSSLTSMTISCEVVDYWYSEYASSSNLPPLTDIIFGEGVKTIKDNAFNGFTNVKTIDIASTVTSIGAKAFSGTNKLTDVACRAIDVPEMDRTAFENSYPNYATLHVPAVSIAAYKATAPWNEFKEIVALKQDLPDDAEKCATPTITYQNGKLSFASETEGVEFNYVITDNDIKAGANAEVQLDATYHISVYAIKEGYKDSETATATLCWIDANPTTEGITQGIASVSANAVLIRSNNGILSITGAPEGTSINVYDMSGKAMGSAKASAETTNVATSLHRGDVGIVKIGEKSVKIMVK